MVAVGVMTAALGAPSAAWMTNDDNVFTTLIEDSLCIIGLKASPFPLVDDGVARACECDGYQADAPWHRGVRDARVTAICICI